ncbi:MULTISPECIES: hypothetical protein [unclassified Ereboglobus]|uniref:hypothetical protein n=1 Tax=unclassified Ereboglobus TaxID=2626932 RepID=UPI002405B78C|nr:MULTISPECIES: hypothetical protein [unclassified Ereboglobus]
MTAFCEKDAFVIGEGKTKDGELVGIQAQAKKNLKSYKAFMAALEKLKGKKLPRTEALKAIKKVLYDGSAFIYPMDGGLQAQVGEWKHRAFALHKGNAAEFQKSLAFQIYTAAAMTIQADATIIQKCEGALARED